MCSNLFTLVPCIKGRWRLRELDEHRIIAGSISKIYFDAVFKMMVFQSGGTCILNNTSMSGANNCPSGWSESRGLHSLILSCLKTRDRRSRAFRHEVSFMHARDQWYPTYKLRICEIWTKISRQNHFGIRTLTNLITGLCFPVLVFAFIFKSLYENQTPDQNVSPLIS
jgi:hypothetical protein